MSNLNEKWRDIEQAITLECPDAAEALIQKMRDLVTCERMAVAVNEQVKAVRFVADSAFPSGKRDHEAKVFTVASAHWIALQRWADRIESGEVKL